MAFTPFTKDDLPTMAAFNEKLQAIFDDAESKAKIEVGSYVGTGTYGSSNPCSITASFPIKAAFMLNAFHNGKIYSDYVMVSDNLSTSFESGKGFMINEFNTGSSYGKRSDDGKTFQWYVENANTEGNIGAQANYSGVTYYVLLIG